LRQFAIHAHFYQPPREDPLTGDIPVEPGASPFPNWNERIHAECYRPNAELGNFARISFNLGPTLGQWMSAHDPATAERIAAQDRMNLANSGVGNAIAQAYNHTILPLASALDQRIQVAWGAAEFHHRFGRRPQGMWLPETAANTQVLSVLAEQGIQFTILAPWQADTDRLDVTEPYRVELPGRRSMAVFFYHAELSAGISFNPQLTINADTFVAQDLSCHFNLEKTRKGEPQLLLLASDGELYGHHQPMRDRFLARLVDGASSSAGFEPTFPALWLKRYPPRRTVNLRENTSWSCHHGVQRWKGGCPCCSGSGLWKFQLRYAFDRLAGALDEIYLRETRPYIPDPWGMLEHYIEVMLGQRVAAHLLEEQAGGPLPAEVSVRLHLLLEAQRERQRMYTSCGFFFDDLDRIEPKNNIAYASQAVRLVRLATGVDLEPYVLDDLRGVTSERTALHADRIFRRYMQQAVLDGRFPSGD
jgi:hypothetical protein